MSCTSKLDNVDWVQPPIFSEDLVFRVSEEWQLHERVQASDDACFYNVVVHCGAGPSIICSKRPGLQITPESWQLHERMQARIDASMLLAGRCGLGPPTNCSNCPGLQAH